MTDWRSLVSAATVSPVAAADGDLQAQWRAPDGRSIQLVVKLPHPRTDAPSLVVPPVAEGDDARPVFEAVLARARALGAARVTVSPGVYYFRSLSAGGLGALLLEDLSDLTLDGNGASLVFDQDAPGVYVTRCRRLRIANIQLEYGLRMASLGKIVAGGDGSTALVVDPLYPLQPTDQIRYLSEFDVATRTWVQGGQRVILPPGNSTPATTTGPQSFASTAFRSQLAGKTFVIFHNWYGGPAVKLEDTPGPSQDEDVVLDAVHIYSSPGMGIEAYGVKRGLAIINSSVSLKPDGSNLISSEFDALHTLIVGGDTLIGHNTLSGQGDDGINLNSPVTPIQSVEGDGRTLVLSTYSRFIRAGDVVAAFDEQGAYLGRSSVSSGPKAMGGLLNQIVLDRPIPGLSPNAYLRDAALTNSRVLVQGNLIGHCNCHGILVQVPNALVQDNVIDRPNYNAIRLLTSLGAFKEGVGAINVIVRHNQISNTGVDTTLRMPWAAISAYGAAHGNVVTPVAVNSDIEISDNVISNAQQGCITVASSRNVVVRENSCQSTNLMRRPSASLNILQSTNVTLSGNSRSGASTGPIFVDDSARNVTVQSSY